MLAFSGVLGTDCAVNIVRANVGHLRLISELEARCHPHPWSLQAFKDELGNPASQIWVTEGVDAYVVVWRVLDELQIQNVTTAPEARRRGYARALLLHVLAQPGLHEATLELRSGNEAAWRLYASLGFELVGKRPRYYSTGEDALLARLVLSQTTHR